jgi:2-polyprenyl-3-methyl-5-hydroxy-6-metoxy-1,4-benzoquinol methylase
MMRFTSGLPETPCGYGSTIVGTSTVRAELRQMLDRLGITSLLDAPCGDFNWLATVDLNGLAYIGIDSSTTNLSTARTRAPNMDFRFADIVSDPMPTTDAVLCRDFLQHLPTLMAVKALQNITLSACGWLLATSHNNSVNGDIAMAGRFRPLNLRAAPFFFPDPEDSIQDGPGRIIGAWRAMVVAGALVLHDVPDHITVYTKDKTITKSC